MKKIASKYNYIVVISKNATIVEKIDISANNEEYIDKIYKQTNSQYKSGYKVIKI